MEKNKKGIIQTLCSVLGIQKWITHSIVGWGQDEPLMRSKNLVFSPKCTVNQALSGVYKLPLSEAYPGKQEWEKRGSRQEESSQPLRRITCSPVLTLKWLSWEMVGTPVSRLPSKGWNGSEFISRFLFLITMLALNGYCLPHACDLHMCECLAVLYQAESGWTLSKWIVTVVAEMEQVASAPETGGTGPEMAH
jgi:hypothetical protein